MAEAFRASVSDNFVAISGAIAVPLTVQVGDGMIAIVTWNNGSATVGMTVSAGWTQLDEVISTTRTSRLYAKIATATDAGSSFRMTTDAVSNTKFDGAIVVYSGTDPTSFIDDLQVSTDGSAGTSHSAPSATVNFTGGWAVTLWSEKSTTNTAWTAPTTPTGITTRVAEYGSSGGALSILICDSNGPVA